ncbi:unnamed protein product, partial [Rodentolepis nana]|uniref:Acyl carrier protein n=1 Tax=Rodentolepis nana TaxID=102285 RepID=A0A0R3THG9_RODNA
ISSRSFVRSHAIDSQKCSHFFVPSVQKRDFSHGPPLNKLMIEDRVMLVLQLYDKINPNKLTLHTDIVNEFGLDSLDMVEVNVAMEEEFAFDIPSADALRLRTPFDIVQYDGMSSDSENDVHEDLLRTTEEVMRAKETNPGMFVSAWQADEEDISYWTKKELKKIGPNWADEAKRLKDFLLAKDEDGYTALHRAVYSGQFLIRSGADIESKTEDGWRPLHSAAFWNQLACVQLLLEVGADITAMTSSGQSVLHLALANNQTPETLAYLLAQLSSDREAFSKVWNYSNKSGDTPENLLMRSSSLGPFLKETFSPEATYLGNRPMF